MANQTTPAIQVKDSNVGIGTNFPLYKLNVIGDISFPSRNTAGTYRIGMGREDGNGWNYTQNIAFISDGNGGYITFSTQQPGVGGDEYMRLNYTGNLLIGTATDNGDKLQVSGDATIGAGSGLSRLTIGSGAGYTALILKNNSAYYNFLLGSQYNVSNAFEITPSTTVGGSTFSTPVVTVLASGNVGIGTTAPPSRLSVVGNIESMITVSTATVNYLKLGTYNAGQWGSYVGAGSNYANTLDTDLRFGVSSGGTASEVIRITAAGNVGIGTTAPTAMLNVANSGRALAVFRIQGTNRSTFYDNDFAVNNDGGGADGFIYGSNSAAGSFPFNGYGEVIIQANPRTGYLNGISFVTGTTSPTVKMRILEGGNVGIGTTSPSQKLHVSGGDGIINNAFIGEVPTYTSANAQFSHTSRAGAGEYSFLSANDGETFINSKTGTNIRFRVNNVDQVIINSAGNVGIGTTNPIIALSVRKDINDWIGQYKNYGNGAYGLTIDLSGSTGATNGYVIGAYSQTGTGFFLKNDGNVGIGTTSPAVKLDVIGDIRTSNSILFDTSAATTTSTARIFFGQNISPTGSLDGGQNNFNSFGVDGYGIILQSGYGTADMGGIKITDDGVMVFGAGDENLFTVIDEDSNSVRFSISNNGTSYFSENVGIGTTTPNAKLEVNGSAKIDTWEIDSYTVNNAWLAENVYFDGTNFRYRANGYAMLLYSDAGSGFQLRMSTGTGVAGAVISTATNLSIKPNGNVQIGTTTDSGEKLRVEGSTFTSGNITTDGYVFANSEGLSTRLRVGGIHGNLGLYIDATYNMQFDLGWNGAFTWTRGNAEKMRLTYDGNLGIGTTAPQTGVKLDVYGAAAVAGGSEGLRIGNVGDNSAYDNVKIYYSGYNSGAPRVYLTPRTTPGSGVVQSYFHLLNSNGSSGASNNTMGLLVDGKVGIGTTSPITPLTIQSDSGAGAIRLRGRAADSVSSIDLYNNAESAGNYIQSNGSWIRARADGGFHFADGATPTTTATNAFSINGMNVLIGTTTDSGYKLRVNGSSYFDAPILCYTGNGYITALTNDGVGSNDGFGYSFLINNTGHEIGRITGKYENSASNGSGGISFYTRNNGTLSQRMSISGNGNVGINTGAAIGLFEVYKSAPGALGGHIVINNDGTAVANETALMFGDGGINAIRAAISCTTENSPYKGELRFKSGTTAYSGLTTNMVIKGNGNVLIGTTTDSGNKLEVAGTVRATTGIFTTGAGYPLQVYQTAATNSTTAIIRQTTAGGNGNNDIGLLVDIQGAGDTDRIANFRYYDGSTATSRMAIMRGGNVGIGTESPITKLSLGGYNGARLPYIDGTGYTFNAAGITVPSSNNANAGIGGGIDLTNNTYSVGAYSPIISFSSLSSNGSYNNTYAAIYGILAGPGGDPNWTVGHIAFATASSFGAIERVRITGNGHLLINTTTDAGYKLDVNGSARIQGNSYVTSRNYISLAGDLPIAYKIPYSQLAGGTVVSDNLANGGSAKVAYSTDTPGTFFFGPYSSIEPGSYVAKFRLKVASNASSSAIGTIDVAGTNIAANSLLLRPSMFPTSGDYYYFSVPFTVGPAASGSVETRWLNWPGGVTDAYVDHVFIESAQSEAEVYVPTSKDFNVYTDGTSKLVVKNNGNVGLGNASPAVKLDMGEDSSTTNVGGIRLRGYDVYEGNIYKTATYGIYLDTDTNLRPIRIDGSAFITGITGNVGIGTTAPTHKLDISSDTSRIVSNSSSYTAWFIANTGTGNAGVYCDAINGDFAGADYGFIGQNNSGYMQYDIAAASPAPYHVFSGGNVGIGTTNPANRLQIGSIGSSGFGGNDIVIGNGTQVMAFYQSATISTWYTNTNFSLLPAGTGAVGNLGVGTDSPTQRVHVSGNLRVTGAYYDSNNEAGSSGQVLSSTGSGTDWITPATTTATSLYDLLPAARVAYNWVGQVVNDTWTTVFTKNDSILTTGTWMVKMYVNDFGVGGGHYQYVYSGIMTWDQGTVNQTGEAAFSEVYLHRMGHAANASILYLRTAESGAAGGNIGYFQIKGNYSNTSNQTIQFQFVKIF